MTATRITLCSEAPGPPDAPPQMGARREGESYWTIIPLNSTTYSFSAVKLP